MILETYFNSKLFFLKYTLYNFKQYINNENIYTAKERVWYDVGYPNRNGIVDLVILGLFIIICFPTLSSISLLFDREIYWFKHQGWRWSSNNDEMVVNFIKNSLILTLIEKINSWVICIVLVFYIIFLLQIYLLNVFLKYNLSHLNSSLYKNKDDTYTQEII